MAFDSGATTMKSDISATLNVNPQCRTGDMPCMGVTGKKNDSSVTVMMYAVVSQMTNSCCVEWLVLYWSML